MKSKIGVTILRTVLFWAHHIPIGIPITIVKTPDNITIASVWMLDSQ
ncbi:Uncharacterised protein [Chlamydia trachomatis]|nr:Uncharacterised protein [Chlamydia trachomatis]